MMAVDSFAQEYGFRFMYEYLKWKYERTKFLLLHYQFIFSFRIHLIFLAAWLITMSDEECKQNAEPTVKG
jgi:Trk-type K+ transport system membrane component